jgi:hypothetical protein
MSFALVADLARKRTTCGACERGFEMRIADLSPLTSRLEAPLVHAEPMREQRTAPSGAVLTGITATVFASMVIGGTGSFSLGSAVLVAILIGVTVFAAGKRD